MANNKLTIGAIVLVAGLLIFLGVYDGGNSTSPSPETHGASVPRAQETAGESNNYAPDFSLLTLDGNKISLSQYRGEKPVILDFWASWCPNCRRDMPKLNAWYKEYKDQVEVIGVNLQESRRAIESYVNSANIEFPIALDPSGLASRAFGVRYTNYHVLIDKNGSIVKSIPGDMREADITSLIGSI